MAVASSQDGVHFEVEPKPMLEGQGALETFGIEDCRVILLDERFRLRYTAVSADGFGVGLASTSDLQYYDRKGMILPPPNKARVTENVLRRFLDPAPWQLSG